MRPLPHQPSPRPPAAREALPAAPAPGTDLSGQPAASVLLLQSTIGNRAVQRLLAQSLLPGGQSLVHRKYDLCRRGRALGPPPGPRDDRSICRNHRRQDPTRPPPADPQRQVRRGRRHPAEEVRPGELLHQIVLPPPDPLGGAAAVVPARSIAQGGVCPGLMLAAELRRTILTARPAAFRDLIRFAISHAPFVIAVRAPRTTRRTAMP